MATIGGEAGCLWDVRIGMIRRPGRDLHGGTDDEWDEETTKADTD